MKRELITIALGLICLSSSAHAQNWVPGPTIPADAIVAGEESNGTRLYVC